MSFPSIVVLAICISAFFAPKAFAADHSNKTECFITVDNDQSGEEQVYPMKEISLRYNFFHEYEAFLFEEPQNQFSVVIELDKNSKDLIFNFSQNEKVITFNGALNSTGEFTTSFSPHFGNSAKDNSQKGYGLKCSR